jgi:hypothetical protein
MIPFPVRWLKFGSFSFAKGRLVSRAKPNVPNAGWLKLFLKKCGGEKNKKLRVGWSVGLPVVELKYGLYVVHVSRWFVYAIWFKFWSVGCLWNGRPTIGYNGFWLCGRCGIESTKVQI